MAKAFGLNCAYMAAAMLCLQYSFKAARRAGTLLQGGE
jgi:hypothetical protein